MNKLVLYLLVCFLFAASVFAVDKHDFVQLVENTDYCFNCHTIYKITKASEDLLSKFVVDFNDAGGEYVFPEFEVSILTSQDYTELVDLYEPCIENQVIINNGTGEEETVEVETQCLKGTEEVIKTRTEYVPISSFNSLKEMYNSAEIGSEYYIKVNGKLKPGEALDNILVLNDYVYDEYAWWNNSCSYRVQFNKTGTGNFPWRATNFQLNSSNLNWTALYNESSIFVTNSSDNLIPYFVTEWNHTSDTAILWVNASPYNNSVMTFYVYYNCTGMSDSQNPNKTVIYFENGNTANTWSTYDGMNYTTDTTKSRWGNSSMRVYNNGGKYYVYKNVGNLINSSFGSSPEIIVEGYAMAPNSSSHVQFMGCSQGPAYDNSTQLTERPESGDIFWYDTSVHSIASYTQGTWRKLKEVINIGSSSSTYDIYIDNMNIINVSNAGTVGTINKCNATILSTDVNGAYGYYDNLIAYPWYNWTAEINAYGGQEAFESIANESYGREAIVAGVDSSEINGLYSAYDDRQVYIRLANGSQYKGTFDKFFSVDSGSSYKRWAFNYDQNTSSGFPAFFNITPVFYVWQYFNLTYEQIKGNVSQYVNSTYP